jgi:hypothetical protein
MHLKKIATGVVALGIGFASAGTFSAGAPTRLGSEGSGGGGTLTMEFERLAAGGDGITVQGTSRPAGHIVHTILSGPGAGSSFATFCVEIQQNVASGPTVYNIVDLTDARIPGPTLTQAQADGINAVVANAVALGWIDGRLQADEGQENFVGRMSAVQAAIWEAMDLDVDIFAAATSDATRDAYAQLLDASTFDGTLRVNGLRALATADGQDMLYVVPLPPAAWAGAGMLALAFGVRTVRRNR